MFGATTSLAEFLLTILALIVIVIFGGAIYAFFHAIFHFIFSQGNKEKKDWAYKSIRYMIIWLVFTIALLTVFPVLFKELGIVGYETFTAQNIFARAGDILNSLLRLGVESVEVQQ